MFSRLGHSSSRVRQPLLNAEKKISSTSGQVSYKSVVPPSRRQAASPLLDARAASLEEIAPSTTEILQKHIPVDSNIKDLHGTFCSPTGFSNDDMTSLGRFPDYATLSGVRLPEPQPDLNIHTAIARPYRPIRWPYNQTMGEFVPTITVGSGDGFDYADITNQHRRFFAKMPTDRLIQRGSWGIEIDQPIHIPPGDPIALRHETQDPDIALDRYHLRVDWQTLRRLPVSAAMVFSFRVLFTPVTQFQNEPYIPSLFLKNYREVKPNLLKHKNIWHTEATILPALELWEREQKEQGIIPEDWQPATLDNYPYYPGWEERWNANQSLKETQ
ncbi:unnamed protein product [Aspergillus oryzae var. brunneus]|uniref:Unnamed protein product n=1 Tax=Aspergillus oryzae var. brunneus TaxID=332754 RepID=A0ABQ6L123_ASPOZ|nr:unnamed protein product [Aspergillus oryzae var. brunneus]